MNTERREAVRDAASVVLHRSSDPLLLNTIADAIADAIEAAMAWRPESAVEIQLAAVRPARWGCGCDARECVVHWDEMRSTHTHPHAVLVATCVPHGLRGRSHPGWVAEGLTRLRAQAMLKLDVAHQEQCR